MDEINENDFLKKQKANPDSNFQNVQLNFGIIEEKVKNQSKN